MTNLEPRLHASGSVSANRNGSTPAEISAWMISYVARLFGRPEATIDRSRTFDEIGLDSMMVVVMTEELGVWLDREINPTSAFDYPTIELFAARVAAMSDV